MDGDSKFVYIQTAATLLGLLGIVLVYVTKDWQWITLSTAGAGASFANYLLWKGKRKR